MPGYKSSPSGFLQLLTWVDISRARSCSSAGGEPAGASRDDYGRSGRPSRNRGEICPYRGLEPFGEEEAAFFCGRDATIDELVAAVRDRSFVSIVGASGSGKSSLVFAGLLPALRKQRETTMWDIVSFRPGASPLHALAAVFATPPDSFGPAASDSYLENEADAYRKGDTGKLRRIVDDRLDRAIEKPDLLLYLRRSMEELYATAPAGEEVEKHRRHFIDVEHFIALLVEATTGQKSRSTVVLTVRGFLRSPYRASLVKHTSATSTGQRWSNGVK